MKFDIDQLWAFEAVMRTRNFRAAARTLNTSQSTISLRIARLERRLGQRLFARTTRRVEPTAQGRALVAYANGILTLAEEARRHFERPPCAASLRLGVVEDFAQGELHPVLGLFQRRFPHFGLTLIAGESGRLFRGLDEGEIDVVLAARPPGRSQARLLTERPMVWCGDPTALAGGTGDAVPIVTCLGESGMRTAIISALRRAGRRFTIRAESDGLTGVRAAVAAGFGVTAFSDGFVPPEVARLGPECGLPVLGTVEYVIDRREHAGAEAVDAFVDLLFETADVMRIPAGGADAACIDAVSARGKPA